MGKQEDIVINFLSKNDRFADLFNGICFEGEQVIEPQSLRPWNENIRAVVKDKDFINENMQYHNLDVDTFMMISKFMNIEEMMNGEAENYINDEGGIDMCEAVRGIYEEGKEEGREEGIRLAKRIFEKKLTGLSAEEIARVENIDIEIVQKVLT